MTRINAFLIRFLNIRPAEWRRVAFLILMLFLVVISNIWGRSIVYGAFLEQVGLDALPTVLMGAAVLSLVVTAVYSAFADRISNDKLLMGILVAGLVGVGIGRFLLFEGFNQAAYPLLYILFLVVLQDTFFLHWWTYVNGFYDTRSAKRIVPVVASAARVASSFAGFTFQPLNNFFDDPGRIIEIWFVALVAVLVMVWLLPRWLKDGRSEAIKMTTDSSKNYVDSLREGYGYISQSTYLLWMAAFTLSLMLLNPFINYQTSDILLRELGSTKAIANYVASLIGITNLLVLPVQLLFSRFINRVGLGNANLVYPLATFVISLALLAFDNKMAAALAYLNLTVFYSTFRQPNDSLLYNAVPLNVKGRARAFVSGLIVPIGALVGGAVLLLPLVNTSWFVPGIIFVLSTGYLIGAFGVRQQYTKALVDLLEQEDYSFLLSQDAEEINVTDPTALNSLKKKLDESQSDEFTIFMARLISEVGGETAVPILAETARNGNSHVRAAILDMLAVADMRGDEVHKLYTDLLDDPDGRVRRSALAGLEHLNGADNRQFLAVAARMLADPDSQVRTEALPPLLKTSDISFQNAAIQVVDSLLQSTNPSERVLGLRAIRRTADNSFMTKVVNHLTDPADEARLEAAITVEEFAAHKSQTDRLAMMANKMTALLTDPVERIRQAALVTLGHLRQPDAHRMIATGLKDSSLAVRETAVSVLVQLGNATIPSLHPLLDSPDAQMRKMAAMILSQINKREYGPLVNTHITSNLLTIYGNIGRLEALAPVMNKQSGLGVLYSALQEQNQSLLNEIFYLLTAVHTPSTVRVVHDSLINPAPHVRANAIEALETFTSPETAQLIAPLLNPEAKTAELVQVGRDKWEMIPPNARQSLEQLITDKVALPWLRTICLYTLGELGAATPPVAPMPENKPAPETAETKPAEEDPSAKRKRRRSAADLLNALTDEPAAETPPVPPPLPAPVPSPDSLLTMLHPPPSSRLGFNQVQLLQLVNTALEDLHPEVRQAAQTAHRLITGEVAPQQETVMLSIIERIIFLKEVLFFQSMTIDQLKVLANVCEEEIFPENTQIYEEGDAGGVMYVVVRGRVGIEKSGRRKGSVARLATIEAHAYFGEMNLFDNSPRTASAIAVQDTLTLRLRREPLIALARQYPDLSLELINILSQSLRETTDRIADLTRTQPRELHKLFDQFS